LVSRFYFRTKGTNTKNLPANFLDQGYPAT
jgi:hypothetical protein